MSHSTKVKNVPITDRKALKKAVKELKKLGLDVDLIENAIPRMYYQNQLQSQLGLKSDVCPFVLKLNKGQYDVGFIEEADKSLTPVFDDFMRRVSMHLGCDMSGVSVEEGEDRQSINMACSISKLLQEYSKQAAINAAEDAGYTVEDAMIDSEGEVILTIATDQLV